MINSSLQYFFSKLNKYIKKTLIDIIHFLQLFSAKENVWNVFIWPQMNNNNKFSLGKPDAQTYT